MCRYICMMLLTTSICGLIGATKKTEAEALPEINEQYNLLSGNSVTIKLAERENFGTIDNIAGNSFVITRHLLGELREGRKIEFFTSEKVFIVSLSGKSIIIEERESSELDKTPTRAAFFGEPIRYTGLIDSIVKNS